MVGSGHERPIADGRDAMMITMIIFLCSRSGCSSQQVKFKTLEECKRQQAAIHESFGKFSTWADQTVCLVSDAKEDK